MRLLHWDTLEEVWGLPVISFSPVTVTVKVPTAGHNGPLCKMWGRMFQQSSMPESSECKTSSLVSKGTRSFFLTTL